MLFDFLVASPYVTVDNQKAAVDHAHWYDPDVNPAFVDFANHWGFAVIPARPYRPQDKGGNECGIGVIQRQFYQEVRERTFYSFLHIHLTGVSMSDQICGIWSSRKTCQTLIDCSPMTRPA